MTDTPEQPIAVSALRKFDQNLIEGGGRLAHRVVEAVPFCWFCNRAAGRRTKEHIFPQWLLRHYEAMDERVHPVRISLALGGVVASERGERPLRAHVNGEVCADCNNGWMSALEAEAQPILTRDRQGGPILADEARTLARWFAKTAVNLNVSQPFRLLVDTAARHGLATDVPPGFVVHLFRTEKQDGLVDWVQKSPDSAVSSSDDPSEILKRLELTLVTHIRIAELVAVVVYTPESIGPSVVSPAGAVGIYPLSDAAPSWDELPIRKDYLDVFTSVQVPD